MSLGLKHFHAARKISPPSDFWKKWMDRIVYAGGLISPLFTVPQILKIWLEKNAGGVSLLSWVAYLLAAIFWLGYGIVHREKPIVIIYAISIIADFAVVLGILWYGRA